jgi:hypothetical protein
LSITAVPWFSFQREIVDRAVLSLKDAGFLFDRVKKLAASRDRWFESTFLQRRVQCEPDFRRGCAAAPASSVRCAGIQHRFAASAFPERMPSARADLIATAALLKISNLNSQRQSLALYPFVQLMRRRVARM